MRNGSLNATLPSWQVLLVPRLFLSMERSKPLFLNLETSVSSVLPVFLAHGMTAIARSEIITNQNVPVLLSLPPIFLPTVGGHLMSSFIGVSLYKLFNLLSEEMFVKLHWLLCSLAVSISLFVMQLTHTVHPPASASALIAVSGGASIYNLGYWYLLSPIALGVALMMVVAMLVNNVARRYPTHWWKPKERKIVVVDQDMATALADFTAPDEEDEDCCTNVDTDEPLALAVAETMVLPLDASGDTLHSKEEIADASVVAAATAAAAAASPSLRPEHQPQSQQPSSPQQPHHSHAHHHSHHPQFAVYYGGDRKEALKEGERLQQHQSPRVRPQSDLEHGHVNSPRPTSIVMEVRGSPHPSQQAHGLGIESSVAISTTSEEEYQSTIEQLRQRVRELENQIQDSKK
jgi:hypothetical protein